MVRKDEQAKDEQAFWLQICQWSDLRCCTVQSLSHSGRVKVMSMLTISLCISICCQVGDNQSLLQSLKDSPYYKSFEDKASVWEQRLADLDELLHNLNQIQRKWVYLEPIFGRGALPKEQARFKRVDDDFRSVRLAWGPGGSATLLFLRFSVRQTVCL